MGGMRKGWDQHGVGSAWGGISMGWDKDGVR